MYIKGWFFVDFICVVPFDLIFEYGNMNRLARFSRFGKFYRLIKITKLVRLIKIVKVKNQLSKYLTDILKISFGVERILLMLVTFLVLSHIAACIW